MSTATVPRARAATPIRVTNPALDVMEPRTREAFAELMLFMADSELIIGHRHSEWTGFAPTAEEDVAFSSIAQDEMGHAHLYYALIAGVADESAVDRLALDRGPRDLRHLPALHAPNGDWFYTIARHVYWDVFENTFLTAARESRAPLLPAAAQRILNEERYHLEHAEEWLRLLSRRGPQRRRLARAMQKVVGHASNAARDLPGVDELARAGLFATREDLTAAFRAALLGRLEHSWSPGEVGPVVAALATRPMAAPPGRYQVHRDLTGLRRAHPGATW